MTNWLTTHYPHPVIDTHLWHIYLQRQHRIAVDGIAIGDRVFFYEFKRHKPQRSPVYEYRTGSQGIVRAAFVSGGIYRRPRADAEGQYSDGTVADYAWGVPTDRESVNGFVARRHVLRVLGYGPGCYLRGFNHGKGVMQLDDGQSRELMELFRAGRDSH
jgi:hypothetical protein